jgi:putative ABC transport system permease protein
MRLRLRTDRLAELLAASRLSQNHWALRLGLSKGHWSDLVNGRHPFPSPKTRDRMLEVFGVTQDELFVADESRADDLEFRVAIAPRYEIMQELGQGAMGTVFLATDRTLGRLVAMKVVSPEAAAGISSTALLKEIAFVARHQHPHILPLFEAGEHAGHPYYVMPWVREGSLRALLQRDGRLSLDGALPLVDGIARGLSYAHERQILHCDVKPENVLVQDGHAFVMDFGIARKLRSEAVEWDGLRTELDFSAGTPAYVSPEQARGDRTVDQRSDVYSLACVVFEMLSGRAPFGGRTTQEIVSKRFHEPPPSLRELVPDLPPRVALALERALSIDPAIRPESARQFADELARSASARESLSETARPATVDPETDAEHLLPPKTRPPSRRPRISMTGFRNDLRYAFRGLRRGWRFALGVILTLGLGVGLGVPVLSLADHFFLRPPPGVADADRVVRLVLRGNGTNGPYFTDGLTGLDYAVMTSRARTLDGVAGWMNLNLSLGRGADARSVSATLASASYFSVLGVRPLAGRFYQESEDVEGVTAAPCVVSHRFWQRDMNGARDAVGREMLIGTVRYTVVGIAPEGFNGLGLGAVDVWFPLHVAAPEFQGHDSQLWNTDHSSWLRMVAHIKPGVPLATATAEAEHLYRTSGERTRDRDLKGTFLWDPLQPGRSSLPNVSAKIALWLSAGGGLLLLLVAANLANLFVARSAAHTRQTAVRLAIGGSWRHLLRLQLSEALILGACSAALGLAVAIPAVKVARTLLLPGVTWVRPLFDARIAAIAFGVAFGVGAIVALWSTAHALRIDPADLLRGAGTTQMSGTRRSHAVRRLLLVVQAAIFAVLVTSASAFVVSLRRASNVDFGFDMRSLMAASIPLPAETPRGVARATMLRAYDRLSAMPQVESASLAYMEPWSNNTDMAIAVPGSSVKPPWTLFDIATPDYLRTFGVRMRGGRWIDASDNAGAPPVIVINESLERVFWPTGGAIGQCMRVGADSMPCRTIVGVVRDFHVTGPVDDPPRPIYYLPVAQASTFPQRPHLFFRPRGDATAAARAVRLALQGLEPNLPAVDVHPVSRNVEWLVSSLRLGASAFTAFGILAAIVGAVGLYSVLSFLIIEQRRMHAIKLALGATTNRVAMSVVTFAFGTALFGMALGYVALLPIAKVLEPMLFRTNVLEPVTVACVVALGSVIALVAALVPVQSVIRTDVMSVLREQ